MQAAIPKASNGVPTRTRRFAAVFIDLFTLSICSSALFSLIPLLIESRNVSGFSWSFERDYARATDFIMPVLVLLEFFLAWQYFAYAIMRQRQTLGCYLTRVVISSGASMSWLEGLRRAFLELKGLFLWKNRNTATLARLTA
jgi:hypothetical protein